MTVSSLEGRLLKSLLKMDVTYLELRRNKVLQITVNTYVMTGVPVSSSLIVKKTRLGLSPATIRTIMAELEDHGYVLQPHISAGRVPTDKGYRYYVDSLMDQTKILPDIEESIRSALASIGNEVREVIALATEILAEFSGNAGIAYMSGMTQSALQRIELIPVKKNKVLVVVITDTGLVKDSLISIDFEVTPEELHYLSRFLNEELHGVAISDMTEHLQRRSLEIDDAFYYLVKVSLRILTEYIKQMTEHLVMRGMNNVLKQPEFNDTTRRASFVQAIDRRYELITLLENDVRSGRMQVHIGTENESDCLKECSFVSHPYGVDRVPLGVVGVAGPTRMDYGRACALVKSVARYLNSYFEELV